MKTFLLTLPAFFVLSFATTAQNTFHFDAVAYGNTKVLISWDVASEKNVNSYSIERSADGQRWELFGLLPGNASSDEKAHFALTDNHPYGGASYYRIQQTGTDNSVYYTDPKIVSFDAETAARLSVVNPVRQSITLRFDATGAGNADIELFDITGKTIHQQESGVAGGINTIALTNLPALPGGVYFVRLSSGGRQYTTKLIRE